MSASFASALRAAHEAASGQHYPEATLYMVATPIGNLADITLRALHVLQTVHAVACEDTRHTQGLLRAYGIERPAGGWIAAHQHNEQEAAQQVVRLLGEGHRVAYVSDAGTPAVSDPGARLATAVHNAGMRVLPLPGASAVTTLLSACGACSPQGEPGFVFRGFLPSRSGERQTAIAQLATAALPTVLLEAPHRIADLARDLQMLGARSVTVGRELTKQFEEVDTVPADQLAQWLLAGSQRSRGEFTLVVHGAESPVDAGAADGDRVLQLLMAELPTKAAVKLAAEITGQPRNALYERALALRDAGD